MTCKCIETSEGRLLPGNATTSVARRACDVLGFVTAGESSMTTRNKSLLLHPFIADFSSTPRVPDYEDVGAIGNLSAASQLLHSIGMVDPSEPRPLVAEEGGVYSATITDQIPALGFVIDWSIGNDEGRPFPFSISSQNFINVARWIRGEIVGRLDTAGLVDRSFTLRCNEGVSGGRIYVPFAYSHPVAMKRGRLQLGVSLAQQTATGDPEEMPLLVYRPDAVGVISVGGIPAAFTQFSASVSMMTAFSPITAEYLAEYDLA